MKYPKINSLYKRQGWYLEEGKKNNPEYQAGRQSLIIGDYASPEFGNIKTWHVQEKIDGTNIRVRFDVDKRDSGNNVYRGMIQGRNEDSLIPHDVGEHINDKLWSDKKLLPSVFELKDGGTVWMFGEGYGARIQKCGGNYRKDVGFMLFDIVINGMWLKQEDVKDLAEKLGIPYAPFIGYMTTEEIVEYVKSKPYSLCSEDQQVMEGIIARPKELLLLRDKDPLMFKLKCKDI